MAEVGTFGGSLTLVSVSDGASGEGYSVEINHDRIYKFYLGNSDTPVFSPESVSFGLYGADKTTLLSVDSYDSELTLIGPDIKTAAGQVVENRVEQVWSLLGRLTGQTIDGSGQTQTRNMLSIARAINTTTNLITFNYALLFEYTVTVGMGSNIQADVDSFNELMELIAQENSCFIINFSQSGTSLINLPVPVEFGTNEDLAKFSVNAASINAAIGNSKLEFSADGLEVTNGGFTIYSVDTSKPEEQQVVESIFYYDSVARSMYVKGNGTFTGTIYAKEGKFEGEVKASTIDAQVGNIGGFTIKDDGLYSTNNSLKLLSSGRIDADNINLGTRAHINSFLQLGERAYIWNPDSSNDHYVIQIKDSNNNDFITLKDSGYFNIGEIEINGITSTIHSTTNSFSITPTLASFSNISASGKISTAIFEEGHIQSVGGAMMFKPSYKIESYSGNTVILDKKFKGSVGDYVYIIKKDGSSLSNLITVTAISENSVSLSTQLSDPVISLIYIGNVDVQNNIFPLIIGVNSSDSIMSSLKPRGITISEFKNDGTIPNPKVFLGDLDKANISFSDGGQKARGFGLYSENVYLTGSLTTKVSDNSYAGVNTLDGVNATKFNNNEIPDTSKIVFWAGSRDATSDAIKNAHFQVTEQGSIYASQGRFTNSIIADSNITSSDIYAARIHGTGRSEETEDYGLSFYDTADGIIFFRGKYKGSPSPTEVFSLGTSGLKKGDDYFIEVGNTVNFKGNNYRTKVSQNSQCIHLYENYIASVHTNSESVESVDTKISLNQQGFNFDISNIQIMNITQNSIEMNVNNIQMNNTILFGGKMKYEKAIQTVNNQSTVVGYNLLIL